MKTKFLVMIEQGDENFSAYSPDVQGCIASGKTVEETLVAMRGAIEFHLEGMLENGEPLPVPRSLSTYVNQIGEISRDDILTGIELEIPQLVDV